MAAPQYVQLFLNKKIRRIGLHRIGLHITAVSRVCPKKLCHLTRLDACTHQGTCPGTSCTSRTSRPWAPPPWPCPSTRRAPWSWGSRGTCHNPGQWPRSDGWRSIISGVPFVLIHCNTRRTNKYTLSEVKRNINIINWNKTDKKIYSWYNLSFAGLDFWKSWHFAVSTMSEQSNPMVDCLCNLQEISPVSNLYST